MNTGQLKEQLGRIATQKKIVACHLFALIYGGILGFRSSSDDPAAFFVFLAFAFILCADANRHIIYFGHPVGVPPLLWSWVILTGSFIVFFFGRTPEALVLGVLLAIICRARGLRGSAWMVIPLIACLYLVPFRTQLILAGSYPLRMISTVASAGLMGLFDPQITFSRTTIYIGKSAIAITDACSGIAQLEAMVLLAYIFVRKGSYGFGWKLVHYLFLFPSILIANSLRLIVLMILFYYIGDKVLEDTLHILLGYAQVVATLGIFILGGQCLPEKDGEAK